MSSIMTIALQLTAIDMMRGVVDRVRDNILSLGNASQQVKRDFDDMNRHVAAGLKGIAVSAYAVSKIRPGVSAAADLQEAMLGVKMNVASSAKDARDLVDMLSQVKGTAISVSANAPFSAQDVVRIQNSLLKAGMELKDVIGDSGAAFAATALASLSGAAPEVVGDSLANIGTMFKFKGADYKEFSDWLTRVDDAAATNLPALIYALRMSGSAAAALGISARDSVTALGALAPLGERAGSSFNNFLLSFATRGKELRAMGLNMFKDGKFVGMAAATDMLRERFGKIQDDGKRLAVLMKIFGEEGGRAANTFLMAEKGFRDIEQQAAGALGMAEKLTIWGEGFNASLKKLGGTAKSTLATIFDPMLAPLVKLVDLANQAVGKIGEFAGKNRAVAVGASTAIGAAAAGAGAYGLYHILKGGVSGAKVLRNIGGMQGLLSTGAGIAKGKAVEAATGVTPVFVTNWPGGKAGESPAAATEALKKLEDLFRKPGTVPSAPTTVPVPPSVPPAPSVPPSARIPALALKAALIGKWAGGAGVAGAAGYGIGALLNKGMGAISGALTGGRYKGEGFLGEALYDLMHRRTAVTEAPRQAVTETPRQAVAETPRQAVTETPRQAVTETPRQAVTETPRQAVTEASRQAVTETPRQAVARIRETPLKGVPIIPATHLTPQAPNIKNEIKINLKVDRFGRVIAASSDPNTSMEINLARGAFEY